MIRGADKVGNWKPSSGLCVLRPRIKVDKMVPACCMRKVSGSIADTLFYKRLSLSSSMVSAAVRQYARQREENE